MPVIEIEVDDETEAALRKLRRLNGKSPDRLLLEAIRAHLRRAAASDAERLEDEDRWQTYVRTGGAVTHAEVDSWLAEVERGTDPEWMCVD